MTIKPQNVTVKTATLAKLRVINRTFDGANPFKNDETNKVNAFIDQAIAKKINQGPDYPLNTNKFTRKGEFITYFK